MGKAENISVSLKSELQDAIASGNCNSISEVVCETLPEWRIKREREAAIKDARRLVAESDACGYIIRPVTVKDVIRRGHERLRAAR